jgi:sodium/proline symporter
VFGAAFGPTIILSLFWKRFTFLGAIAGIVTGAAVVVLWLTVPVLSDTGLYEIIPGFIAGLLAAVITTIIGKKPSAEVEELFEKAITYQD